MDSIVKPLGETDGTNKNSAKIMGTSTSKRKYFSSFLGGTLSLIAIASLVGGGGCAIYKYVSGPRRHSGWISGSEIAYAERNLGRLFASAQQNFIHRNQTRMAESIDELGDGFSINSSGTIIYRDIWYARHGRPESDMPPTTQQTDWERDALTRPYRYAVIPVRDLESPILDARTSVLVAVPTDMAATPMLLMVAGPVRRDPADFLKEWPTVWIEDTEGCRLVRDLLDSGGAYDKRFAEKLAPHLHKPF